MPIRQQQGSQTDQLKGGHAARNRQQIGAIGDQVGHGPGSEPILDR